MRARVAYTCTYTHAHTHTRHNHHALRYTNAAGAVTEQYPYNPNGSPLGIAALCSENGRHLAMMPHPERCFLTWQLPW